MSEPFPPFTFFAFPEKSFHDALPPMVRRKLAVAVSLGVVPLLRLLSFPTSRGCRVIPLKVSRPLRPRSRDVAPPPTTATGSFLRPS